MNNNFSYREPPSVITTVDGEEQLEYKQKMLNFNKRAKTEMKKFYFSFSV